jgi:hypothetical protein
MTRLPTLSLLLLLLALAGAHQGARAAETEGLNLGRYHALIIGNNDYKHLPKLETAVRDAQAIAELLQSRYGFAVTLLLNADREAMLAAMNELRGRLEPDDNLLIYYAGHGTLDRQSRTGFWLPVDAKDDSDINWIANDTLTRYLRAMLARHVMVIADSCYSGALVRAVQPNLKTPRDRLEWLRRMSKRRSRTAIVSGGLEPVTDAGRNGHSVFANALLAALRDNEGMIDGQTLFRQISRPVVLNADQTPLYSDVRRADHEGGDFIFAVLGGKTAKAASSADPAVSQQVDMLFWQSVANSRDVESFQLYLQQFPNGAFAGLAHKKIRELGGAPKPEAPAPKPVPKPAPKVAKLAPKMPGDAPPGRASWSGISFDCDLTFGRRTTEVRVLVELAGKGAESATLWLVDVASSIDMLKGKNPRWRGRSVLIFDFDDIEADLLFEFGGASGKALILETAGGFINCAIPLDREK